jgi:hypothetical protein
MFLPIERKIPDRRCYRIFFTVDPVHADNEAFGSHAMLDKVLITLVDIVRNARKKRADQEKEQYKEVSKRYFLVHDGVYLLPDTLEKIETKHKNRNPDQIGNAKNRETSGYFLLNNRQMVRPEYQPQHCAAAGENDEAFHSGIVTPPGGEQF